MKCSDLLIPFKWISKTFTDDKGIPDHKRITGFLFCSLVAYMIIGDKIDSFIRLYALLALLASILLLYNVIKSQDVIQFKQGYNDKKDEAIKDGDSITITKE